MAARIRKIRHDEETRAKIKATQLLKRLTDHALGLTDMTPSMVRAAEVALRKVLPDLAAVEHSGDVQQTYIVRMPSVVSDLASWDEQAKAELDRTRQTEH